MNKYIAEFYNEDKSIVKTFTIESPDHNMAKKSAVNKFEKFASKKKIKFRTEHGILLFKCNISKV